MTTPRANPRIYVGSVSDYAAGRLHGLWIEAVDVAEVSEAVKRMLRNSRELVAEEHGIFDFENFGAYRVDERESLEVVCAIGAAIVEHGEVFAEYVNHVGPPRDADDVATQVERFRESYHGEWDSLTEWAESFLEDTGALKDVPESLRNYIDFERWADDAEMSSDIFSVEDGGKVHVFWNH